MAASEPLSELLTSIHRTHAVLLRLSDRTLLDRFGFGASQFRILWILHRHQLGIQHSTIAKFLNQTEAAVSRQIRLMVDDQLLQSRVDPNNRRSRVVVLTAKGERVATDAMKVLEDIHRPLFAALPVKDVIACKKVLDSVFMHCKAEQ